MVGGTIGVPMMHEVAAGLVTSLLNPNRFGAITYSCVPYTMEWDFHADFGELSYADGLATNLMMLF